MKAFLFDFSRTLLFPKDKSYKGELNLLHKELSKQKGYSFLSHFELNHNLINYLSAIKDQYPLYIFTSGSIQNAPEIKPRLDDVFIKIFSAEDLGLSKKTPEAYKLIATQIGVNPNEILFIDDSQSNIDAAKIAGAKTLLYTDFSGLQNAITRYLK